MLTEGNTVADVLSFHCPMCNADLPEESRGNVNPELCGICEDPANRPGPAAHTPGPWSWTNDDGRVRIMARLAPSDGLAVLTDADESNARLIAAAPDLLEALQDILDDLEAGVPVMDRFGARDAIAKATGQEAGR